MFFFLYLLFVRETDGLLSDNVYQACLYLLSCVGLSAMEIRLAWNIVASLKFEARLVGTGSLNTMSM